MGFWAFMFISVLLLPLLMILFGTKFGKGAPKSINGLYGYRTQRSMRNWDTWQYAHLKFGRLWKLFGIIMLPLSAVAMALTVKMSVDAISIFGIFIMGIQCIVLLVPIFITEKDLKNNFDENGKRTEESLAKEQQKYNESTVKEKNKTKKKEKVK